MVLAFSLALTSWNFQYVSLSSFRFRFGTLSSLLFLSPLAYKCYAKTANQSKLAASTGALMDGFEWLCPPAYPVFDGIDVTALAVANVRSYITNVVVLGPVVVKVWVWVSVAT